MPTELTKNFRRRRLKARRLFDPRSFRTIVTGRSRRVVACPRGHWHPRGERGRQCDVGLQTESVLTPRKRGRK